jgi:lysophospholipase L1-like esterase
MPLATLVVVLASLVAACGGARPAEPSQLSAPARTPSPSASVAPSVDLARPVGVIAVGHSGLTGEGTSGGKAASWATGDAPDIDSIYLRLTDVRPETRGRVANGAVGGATVGDLAGQIQNVLADVPAPALAIVSTGDNDIQCDGRDDKQVPSFGQALSEALTAFHQASPNTKVLLHSEDRGMPPDPDLVAALVAAHPEAKAAFTGGGPCDFYNAQGMLVSAHFTAVSKIIDSFEGEQTRVCSLVPNCSTDGGVRRGWVHNIDDFSSDFSHFSDTGQAAEAERMWPVVRKVLGL